MTLIDHARYELELIGCAEPERTALLAAVEGFAKGGWSGGSVGWGVETLTRLLEFKPLSEITSDPAEWNNVTGPPTNGAALWQSKRRSSSFSRDGGKTWYDVSDASLNRGDVWDRNDASEWEPVELGTNVKLGDRVRVRLDAFDDNRFANLHNGREGELTAVDSGACVVRYEDRSEYRFLPEKLEVLKTTV